ncbi:MAG: transcriptional regulator, GntR family [Thermomicrobiales bacterium]|nr:transcriptional regulator, GntR family [Thermomicrobiales bacterium]
MSLPQAVIQHDILTARWVKLILDALGRNRSEKRAACPRNCAETRWQNSWPSTSSHGSRTTWCQARCCHLTIVREALKALAAKDVITIANGKGAIVRPMTSEPLRDFFQRALRNRHATAVELLEVRKGIEVQSAALAAQRRTPSELAELKSILPALGETVRDPAAFTALDTQFHLLVAAASHNKMLHHLIESIREPMQESMRAVSRRRVTEEQHAFALTAHARIVDAIERADPEVAGSAMAAHFNVAISLVQADADDEFA